MATEITIRFEDSHSDVHAFWEDLICYFDIDADFRGYVIGGLYFKTERSPVHFFEWLFDNNFEMSHFENIEFKSVG